MTYEDFNLLWENELKEELSSLEVLREQYKRAVFHGIVVGVVVSILSGFLFAFSSLLGGYSFPDFSIFLGFLFGFLTFFLKHPTHYRKQYKEQIVSRVVGRTKYQWKLDLTPYSALSLHGGTALLVAMKTKRGQGVYSLRKKQFLDMFADSGLFNSRVTSFTVDDVLASAVMPLSAAEISAVRGRGKYRQVIFRGLLFKFDLSRTFSGETYICNERGSLSSVPMGSPQSRDFRADRLKITKLEWNDFEELLQVHTTNELEAREILDPYFMEVLYEWWREHKKTIRIGFRGTHMYLAAPFSRDLFEPRPFSSISKHKEELWQYLDSFLFAEKIFSHLERKYRLDLRKDGEVSGL